MQQWKDQQISTRWYICPVSRINIRAIEEWIARARNRHRTFPHMPDKSFKVLSVTSQESVSNKDRNRFSLRGIPHHYQVSNFKGNHYRTCKNLNIYCDPDKFDFSRRDAAQYYFAYGNEWNIQFHCGVSGFCKMVLEFKVFPNIGEAQ